jgi:hypothetical protein
MLSDPHMYIADCDTVLAGDPNEHDDGHRARKENIWPQTLKSSFTARTAR